MTALSCWLRGIIDKGDDHPPWHEKSAAEAKAREIAAGAEVVPDFDTGIAKVLVKRGAPAECFHYIEDSVGREISARVHDEVSTSKALRIAA